jgi:hypothetical protein
VISHASCAKYWPPLGPLLGPARGELGWAGCAPGGPNWPLCRWVRWPVSPTGTEAGFSAPRSSVPVPAAARGPEPGAEAARVTGSKAWSAAPSTCPGTGCNSPSFGKAPSDRTSLPSSSHFHSLTRCSCADSDWRCSSANRKSGIRAADRSPGTRLHYPVSIYIASVDHTGLLLRSPRCSVITQRARMQQRLRFFMCRLALALRGSSAGAGQSRRKKGLSHPGREPRGCLHAGGEQRGNLAAAAGRQVNGGDCGCREGPFASRIWYPLVLILDSFVQPRASRAGALGGQDFIA